MYGIFVWTAHRTHLFVRNFSQATVFSRSSFSLLPVQYGVFTIFSTQRLRRSRSHLHSGCCPSNMAFLSITCSTQKLRSSIFSRSYLRSGRCPSNMAFSSITSPKLFVRCMITPRCLVISLHHLFAHFSIYSPMFAK